MKLEMISLDNMNAVIVVPPLPNLVSMVVTVIGFHSVLLFPIKFRELDLKDWISPLEAEPITQLTRLTSLRVRYFEEADPFKGLATLTALRRLDSWCGRLIISTVGELTLLTHLRFKMHPGYMDLDVAPLKRLHNLVLLEFGRVHTSQAQQLLLAMGAVTCLKSLTLQLQYETQLHPLPYTCVSHLTALGLVRLFSDAVILPGFNMEGLISLTLGLSQYQGPSLSPEGVGALSRATKLTHFGFHSYEGGPSVEAEKLGLLLSRMSKL
jgi:hypothetical protein